MVNTTLAVSVPAKAGLRVEQDAKDRHISISELLKELLRKEYKDEVF